MTLDRRDFVCTLGAGALVLSVAPRASAATALTFVTPFGFLVGYAEVLCAKSGGHFATQGLDVTFYGGRGAATAVQQVLSGQALLSRTGGGDLMRAVVNQDAPLLSVATVVQGSPFFLVSKKGAPILAPKDMVGKTIGIISKGGAVDNLLDVMLINNGIDAKSVNREVVGNSPGAFGLIEQGRIHAFFISTGSYVQLKMSGAAIEAWNTDKFAPIPGQILMTSKAAAEKDPETIVKFLRAVDATMIEVMNDKDLDNTMGLLRPYDIPEMKDLAAAKEGLRAELAEWTSAGEKNRLRHVPERWQTARDLMAKAALMKPGPADVCYTNKYIDQART
jgi:ABC-type nitrate/sulfonate/bicarbonate transport system substrate-binding protein